MHINIYIALNNTKEMHVTGNDITIKKVKNIFIVVHPVLNITICEELCRVNKRKIKIVN